MDFRGKVKRAYTLKGQRVLVLEKELAGDVVGGEWIEVDHPSGEPRQGRIASVAWGSAFQADESPLTLVVEGLGDHEPAPGDEVRTSQPPPAPATGT
jgi:hypothetical protein